MQACGCQLTMIVAVASPLSPPQHCPILGHLASSHTVWRLSPRRSFLILLKEADVGMVVFRYLGKRGLLCGRIVNTMHLTIATNLPQLTAWCCPSTLCWDRLQLPRRALHCRR